MEHILANTSSSSTAFNSFSGLCAAIRLQTQLDLFTYTVFELETDIGGTWLANTYPGNKPKKKKKGLTLRYPKGKI